MEKVKILVIGAGVVGLAIAKYLSSKYEDVVVVEKEKSFGQHTSSRNSEVIHSGIYYPTNSLKARLCVKGKDLLYEYANRNDIPCKKTGKLVVASKKDEFDYLDFLLKNGKANQVKGLKIISEQESKELEPTVKALQSLWVPSTGIIDTHTLMKTLETEVEENDGFIIYDMEVSDIKKKENGYEVHFSNGEIYFTEILINSAGLFSDVISQKLGIDVIKEKLKIFWCKGEYFKSTNIKNIKHLIYPIPDPNGVFLGIHLTINLAGEVRFGPNAYYVDNLNYSMNENNRNEFLESINRYMTIDMDSIHPDDTGIRPKLQAPEEGFRDFIIREESNLGFSNYINLTGIESPGLTCCLAIGEEVLKLLQEKK